MQSQKFKSEWFIFTFGFCCCSVFVSTTNIEGIITSQTANLAKTSAESTQPTMLPKCGTLLTYGKADVINIFLSPLTGSTTSGFFDTFCDIPMLKDEKADSKSSNDISKLLIIYSMLDTDVKFRL